MHTLRALSVPPAYLPHPLLRCAAGRSGALAGQPSAAVALHPPHARAHPPPPSPPTPQPAAARQSRPLPRKRRNSTRQSTLRTGWPPCRQKSGPVEPYVLPSAVPAGVHPDTPPCTHPIAVSPPPPLPSRFPPGPLTLRRACSAGTRTSLTCRSRFKSTLPSMLASRTAPPPTSRCRLPVRPPPPSPRPSSPCPFPPLLVLTARSSARGSASTRCGRLGQARLHGHPGRGGQDSGLCRLQGVHSPERL